MTITAANISKVYSGTRRGCMCGCNGNYSDSPKAKKAALTRMLKTDFSITLWGRSDSENTIGYMLSETPTRQQVIYLMAGTEIPADMQHRVRATQ